MSEVTCALRSLDAGQLNTIVVIGAGHCSELNDLLALRPDQLILVEADEMLAAELNSKLDSNANISVIISAVTGTGRDVTFYVINSRRYSSVLMPTGLMETLPNLRIVEKRQLPSIPLRALTSKLDDGPVGHVLIIDAPGIEIELITATPAEELQRFAHIVLRTYDEQFYETFSGGSDATTALSKVGFRETAAARSEFSSSIRSFRRDEHMIQLASYRELVASQANRITELLNQLNVARDLEAGARTYAESLAKDLSDAVTSKNGEIAQLRDRLENAFNEIKRELGQCYEQRNVARDALERSQLELRQRNEALAENLGVMRKLQDENRRMAALVARLRERQRNLRLAVAEQIRAHRAEVAHLEQDIVDSRQDLFTAQQERAALRGDLERTSAQLNDACARAEQLDAAAVRAQHRLAEAENELVSCRQVITQSSTASAEGRSRADTLEAELHQAREAISSVNRERAEGSQLVAAQTMQLRQLHSALAGYEQKHDAISIQLERAEAQIELICDLLLRGPGL